MWRNPALIFAIWVYLLSSLVNGKHYRGGTVYWSAVDDNPEQVKITYRLGFKLNHVEPGHDDCTINSKESGEMLQTTGYLKCDGCNNGRDQKIQDLEYRCTDYDDIGQWASGLNSVIYDAPSTQFNISYENCCWIDLVSHDKGTGRGWKLTTSVDLRRRPDTGRINSSPISEALPVQFMEKGCNYALQIPVIDPDNDVVRCRWPHEEYECNKANDGACGPTPKAKLKGNDCTLRFNTKKMEPGWHAVILIIEDFANETSTEPLSKVSLQFLLNLLDTTSCNKPKVVSPPSGLCRTIPAESPFYFPLLVSVAEGRRLSSFTTLKPAGMTASEVRPIQGAVTEFYSLLSWTPTMEQIGEHTVCFQATDNYDSPTDMTCMHLNVMESSSIGRLTAEPETSPGSDRGDYTSPERLRFIFSGEIQQPKESKHISILDSSGVELFKMDVSNKSADISYEGRVLEFGFPPHLLYSMGSGYQLVFEAGIAKGSTKCGIESEPYEWDINQLATFPPPIISTQPSHQPNFAVLPGGRKPASGISAPRPPPVTPDRPAVPECFSSSMTIYVSKKIVGEIDPSRMHLIDPSCRGELHNDTHYVIGTGYGMCGTTFEMDKSDKDGNYKVLANIVYLPAAPYTNGSIITREHNIEIHVNCTLASEHLTHVEFDPDVKTLVYYESGYGRFNFSLKMYKNDNFKKFFKQDDFPIDVNLKQRLYFEARSWARSGTELLLDSCRATPTANPFDSVHYTFIQDGCEVDDTVKMHPIRFSLRKRFSISAFAFLGRYMEDSVFIHCDMRICDLLDPNSRCARSCAPIARISKRDVTTDGTSSAAYQETDGPIRIVQSPEDFEEVSSVFNANADLVQTVMIGVVILLLIVLMVLHLRGITCRKNKDLQKGADFI